MDLMEQSIKDLSQTCKANKLYIHIERNHKNQITGLNLHNDKRME